MSSVQPAIGCSQVCKVPGDVYNDTFYAIARSAAINEGAPSNISFDRDSNEVTVNVAFFEPSNDWSVDLTETPFGIPEYEGFFGCPEDEFVIAEGCELPSYCSDRSAISVVGSGSGWLTTLAPIYPGEETITVTFSIHDEGDAILDSVVLIDDFQWLPMQTQIRTLKE